MRMVASVLGGHASATCDRSPSSGSSGTGRSRVIADRRWSVPMPPASLTSGDRCRARTGSISCDASKVSGFTARRRAGNCPPHRGCRNRRLCARKHLVDRACRRSSADKSRSGAVRTRGQFSRLYRCRSVGLRGSQRAGGMGGSPAGDDGVGRGRMGARLMHPCQHKGEGLRA